MRKFLSSTLVAVTALVPLIASAIGIEVIINGQAIVFTDVPQSAWFATYVKESAEAGIVTGYEDSRGKLTGRFGPENRITVAEALKIAVRGAGYDDALYGSMIDGGVGSHWASGFVSVAIAEHFAVLSGKSNVRVYLDRPASRAEVASMFTSAFGVNIDAVSPIDTRYGDVNESTSYAPSIEKLSQDGVVSGDTNMSGEATGTFRPSESINRAEVAKIVINARAKYGTPGKGKRPTEQTSMLVRYTNAGFSPTVLRVKLGTTVTFRNDSSLSMWVASNPHPTHTIYPSFDALRGFAMGDSYSFTFTQLGSFGYHNHFRSSHAGTIIVEQ